MHSTRISVIPTILITGALWGIFEATVGYALHLVPWKIGAYVWFPAAYFFMDRVYRATGKRWAVVSVALVSSAIKLLNLMSPIRPDYVINPAISIIMESFSMIIVLSVAALNDKRATLRSIATRVLVINTLWRLMYTLYLALLAPAWMREISAIRSAEAYLAFILGENLLSTIACVMLWGIMHMAHKFIRIRVIDVNMRVRYAAAGFFLCCSVIAQFVF